MQRIYGLPAVASKSARILIVGSMPGAASLHKQQYYAHPQNAFWQIMGELLGFDATLSYSFRLQQLRARNIALWDVVNSCKRQGSLDTAIKTESIVTNDFQAFFHRHRKIQAVFFNGRKSQQLYLRHVAPMLQNAADNLEFRLLPSTSPAHARVSRADKLEQWRRLLGFL